MNAAILEKTILDNAVADLKAENFDVYVNPSRLMLRELAKPLNY